MTASVSLNTAEADEKQCCKIFDLKSILKKQLKNILRGIPFRKDLQDKHVSRYCKYVFQDTPVFHWRFFKLF